MSNKEKQPLTYTVGDTAFGEALRSVAEQAQKPGENRDKKNGERHRFSSRKEKNMSTPDKHPSPDTNGGEKKDIAPAGGPSKTREVLGTVGKGARDLAYDGARGTAFGIGGALGVAGVYLGLKWVGAPIP